MRLIDADAFLEKMKSTMRYFTTKNDIAEMPTIDPVYAAGGCYCRECECWLPPEPQECIEAEGLCLNGGGFTHTDDFCSHGIKKEEKQ